MINMAVWKFELSPTGLLYMPAISKPLHVGEQDDNIYLWALVDPTTPNVKWDFTIIGTGWTFNPPNYPFVGTVQMSNGLVFHVWVGR